MHLSLVFCNLQAEAVDGEIKKQKTENGANGEDAANGKENGAAAEEEALIAKSNLAVPENDSISSSEDEDEAADMLQAAAQGNDILEIRF